MEGSSPAATRVRRPKLRLVNLGLRGLMEAGVVLALGWWGYRTGTTEAGRFLLAIGAALVGFGFWGLVDFRSAGSLAEPLRLLEELLISGLAAAAWIVAGQPLLGWALAAVSVSHHRLVYLLGDTLLKR